MNACFPVVAYNLPRWIAKHDNVIFGFTTAKWWTTKHIGASVQYEVPLKTVINVTTQHDKTVGTHLRPQHPSGSRRGKVFRPGLELRA